LLSFLFSCPATSAPSTLSLHDALPILPALADLDLIQDYIAERSPPVASRLINNILDRTDKLLSVNPEIGRSGRVSGTRELILVGDRKSTRLNSSHVKISYAVFCLKKKK